MVTQVKERTAKISATARAKLIRPFGLSRHELVASVAVFVVFILTLIFYYTSRKPRQDEVATLERQLENLNKTETEFLKDLTREEGPAAVDLGKMALESLDYFKGTHL